jgi:hypothetical protein
MTKLIRYIGICGYLCAASSAGFILSAPVEAAPGDSATDMEVREHKNESVEHACRRVNKSRQVRGTVLQSERVKIKGSDLTNSVILLRTQDGNRILVIDAGRSDKLSSLELDRGKRIGAQGKVVTMRGQQVLVASDITQGDQRVAVDRSQEPQQLARRAHEPKNQQK